MQMNDTQKTVMNNSSDYNNIQKQQEILRIINNNKVENTMLIPFKNMEVKKMNKMHFN